MAFSSDLRSWTKLRRGGALLDAMPVLPPWARPGFTWAPEVLKTRTGYVLYFTARDRGSGLQCIGTASATTPTGPFASTAAAPLVCQTALGGSIDPDPFRDRHGSLILYYKNDGNNPAFRLPTRIYAQRLSADGLSLSGPPVALLANTAPWEGRVIEAPTMVRQGDGYTLFYSANDYGWTESGQRLSAYAIGYARCQTALGPCLAARANPILQSRGGPNMCLSGPGHQSLFQAGGRNFIAFHAWAATAECRPRARERNLYIALVRWVKGQPVIAPDIRREAARAGK